MHYLSVFSIIIAHARSTTLEGLYGLTFSPTSISASRINSSGTLEVTSYPADYEYLQYYNDVLYSLKLPTSDREGYQRLPTYEKIEETFGKDIKKVKNALKFSSGSTPEYSTVFIPSIFNRDTHHAALKAVAADTEHGYGYFNYGTLLRACCHAFDFLDGTKTGRTLEERNDDSIETFVLVLEYEEEYLHVGTMQIMWEREAFATDREDTCLECGERYRRELGDKKYTRTVKEFLEAFIEKTLKGPYRPHHDNIRSIVLAGDASQAAFSELGALALSAVGTNVVPIATGVEPSEVRTRGAAMFARWIQKYKGSEIIEYCDIIPDEEYYEQNRLMEEYRLEKKKLAEQNKLMVIRDPHEVYHEEL